MEFEVLMARKIRMAFFWVRAVCNVTRGYQRLEGKSAFVFVHTFGNYLSESRCHNSDLSNTIKYLPAACYIPRQAIIILIGLTVLDEEISLSLSLSLSSVAPTLEHRISVKRFVLLQFLNPKTVGRTPWTGDQPIARPLPTQAQNKHKHSCIE
jgi:hypothetical protein